ncbi:phosphotransferase family protein [Paenibacillus sinopodophylli]|uniref:phosphotransferase family protein n=1 Tax=Paenibacillus sinopodophylli TaxID=1837342 RepID=UPI001485C57F|nr:phosphotransferase [Paenibacillus sinopodophylli]
MVKRELIGKGMTAEVYAWGQDQVLKRYYDWVQKEWIKHEWCLAKAVNDAGAPSPRPIEMIEVDGMLGLLYERIAGTSMLSLMQASPQKAVGFSEEMAQLHIEVHRCSGAGLLRQKDVLVQAISESATILLGNMERVCTYLDALPEGGQLCHGDFHPDNIMLTDTSSVVIDWNTATNGQPSCDVARTSLMLRSPFVSEIAGEGIKTVQYEMHRAYIEKYTALSGISLAEVEAWMLPVAAARLRENIPGEQDWLLGIIEEILQGTSKTYLFG